MKFETVKTVQGLFFRRFLTKQDGIVLRLQGDICRGFFPRRGFFSPTKRGMNHVKAISLVHFSLLFYFAGGFSHPSLPVLSNVSDPPGHYTILKNTRFLENRFIRN